MSDVGMECHHHARKMQALISDSLMLNTANLTNGPWPVNPESPAVRVPERPCPPGKTQK